MPVDPRVQALLDAKLQMGPSIKEVQPKKKKGGPKWPHPSTLPGRDKRS